MKILCKLGLGFALIIFSTVSSAATFFGQCDFACDPYDANDAYVIQVLTNFAPLTQPGDTLIVSDRDWDGTRRMFAVWERTDTQFDFVQWGYEMLAGSGNGNGNHGGGGEGGNPNGGTVFSDPIANGSGTGGGGGHNSNCHMMSGGSCYLNP